MKILSMTDNDAIQASKLIERSFSKAVAPTLTEEGANRFRRGAQVGELSKRLAAGNRFFVAKNGDSIIGVAELRDGNHLNLLFVDPDHQFKGVGKALLKAVVRSVSHRIAMGPQQGR